LLQGCDASILLDSTPTNIAEKDAIPNLSVGGYKVIDEIKDAVEKACPGAVSCADILALACRDAVSFENVSLGRKDGRVSKASEALMNLPSADANFTELLLLFKTKGMDQEDLVVLSGRCGALVKRLYNFTGVGDTDPSLSPEYNEGILPSDVTLLTDKQSADMSKAFAGNQDLFFDKFGKSMIKMGDIGMGAGGGEIRKNCRVVN
ncbi:Peroxidase 24, partial [Linum perenne]